MVDFRYHLVSIIAVILALTVGVVLGSSVLNGPVLDDLNQRVDRQSERSRALETEVRDLETERDRGEAFAATVLPDLVDGQLAGTDVVVVSTPGSSDSVRNDVIATLRRAGADVSAQVSIRERFLDPASGPVVDVLVNRLVPAGVTLPSGTATDRACAELAAVLMTKPGGSAVSDSSISSVLAGFREADLLSVESVEPTPGTLAVLITGDSDPQRIPEDGVKGLLTLARALDEQGNGTVVAGPRDATLDGGLLAGLRGDSSLASEVSGVDGADGSMGQVAVIYALIEQRRGAAGQYGLAAADPLPSPEPSR